MPSRKRSDAAFFPESEMFISCSSPLRVSSRYLLRLLGMALLLALLIPRGASAERVSWNDIKRMCSRDTTDPSGYIFEKLGPCKKILDEAKYSVERAKAFCALADEQSDTEWKGWADQALTLPPVDVVQSLAKCSAPPESTDSSVPGFNQSAVLWGAADFLVGRAREELQVWLYDTFVKQICEGSDPATSGTSTKLTGNMFFPATCKALNDPQISLYLGGIPVLQSAIRQDLQNFPVVMLDTWVHTATDPKERDAARAVSYFAMILQSLLDGIPVFDAIGDFSQQLKSHTSLVPQCADGKFAIGAYTVPFLVVSLNPKDSSLQLPSTDANRRQWLMAAAVNMRAAATSDALRPRGCSVGHPTVDFDPSFLFQLLKLTDTVTQVSQFISVLGSKEVKSGLASSATPDQRRAAIVKVFGSLLELVSNGAPSIYKVALTSGAVKDEDLKNLKGRVDSVIERIGILQTLSQYATAGRYWDMALVVLQFVDKTYGDKAPKELRRLILLGIDVIQAKDPDSARAALARFSAPQGSYKRKRHSGGWYLGVNAYVGAAVGVEWGKQQDDTYSNARPALAVGPWLPIGLEIGSSVSQQVSLGVFVQAIDIGALAYWRVTTADDQLQNRPEVGFSQVFSPGAFLMIGLPKMPLSLGLGAAWAPRLRSLVNGTSDAEQRDAIRLNLALAVDIPIFP